MDRIRFTLLAVLLAVLASAGELLLSSVSAATSLERHAFQLTGASCISQQTAIITTLLAIPGIHAVDFSSVPDHALVDIDADQPNGRQLLSVVIQAMNSRACQAEIMRSCVSTMSLSGQSIPVSTR
ncbi:MAG TPA: hypothetical protein VIU63_06730, partial [Nitrospira sp.]